MQTLGWGGLVSDREREGGLVLLESIEIPIFITITALV